MKRQHILVYRSMCGWDVVNSCGCVGIGYVAVRGQGAICPFLEWVLTWERKDMSRHVPFVPQLLDLTTWCTRSLGDPIILSFPSLTSMAPCPGHQVVRSTGMLRIEPLFSMYSQSVAVFGTIQESLGFESPPCACHAVMSSLMSMEYNLSASNGMSNYCHIYSASIPLP